MTCKAKPDLWEPIWEFWPGGVVGGRNRGCLVYGDVATPPGICFEAGKKCLKIVTELFCSTSLRDHLLYFPRFFSSNSGAFDISRELSRAGSILWAPGRLSEVPAFEPFLLLRCMNGLKYWLAFATFPVLFCRVCEMFVRYFAESWKELCCFAALSVLWCHTHLIDLWLFWKTMCHRTVSCLTYQLSVRIKK